MIYVSYMIDIYILYYIQDIYAYPIEYIKNLRDFREVL